MEKISVDTVKLVGFGMDCFAVSAPKGCDISELESFLINSNARQREHIKFSHTYEMDTGETAYVFSESGGWCL